MAVEDININCNSPTAESARDGSAEAARGGGDGTKSGPNRQNLLRGHDLFCGTGKMVFVFSGPAGDLDPDGFQAAVFHPQAELFVDFLDAVLLEAVAHAGSFRGRRPHGNVNRRVFRRASQVPAAIKASAHQVGDCPGSSAKGREARLGERLRPAIFDLAWRRSDWQSGCYFLPAVFFFGAAFLPAGFLVVDFAALILVAMVFLCLTELTRRQDRCFPAGMSSCAGKHRL